MRHMLILVAHPFKLPRTGRVLVCNDNDVFHRQTCKLSCRSSTSFNSYSSCRVHSLLRLYSAKAAAYKNFRENMKFMSFFVQRQSKVFNEKNERNWSSPTPYWEEIADRGWFSCTPYFYTGPIGKGEWRRWIRTILWSMEYVSLTELRTRTVL